MDVYGKIVGKMKLGTDEQARLNALVGSALPAPTPDQSPPGAAPQSLRNLRLHGRKLVQTRSGGDLKKPPDKKQLWKVETQERCAIGFRSCAGLECQRIRRGA